MIHEIDCIKAISFTTRNGSSNNYTDHIRQHTDLCAYQFLAYMEGDTVEGIAGLSPNLELSIYANNQAQANLLLDAGLSLVRRPAAIFADLFLNENISSLPFRITRHEEVLYFSKYLNLLTALKPSVCIREAGPADQHFVEDWYQVYNASEGTHWVTPTLRKPDLPRLFIAVENGDFICGCSNTLTNTQRFWIGRLFTMPSVRRCGIATQMMDWIENVAVEEGKTTDMLVFAKNLMAINFYQRRGYVLKARRGYWKIG